MATVPPIPYLRLDVESFPAPHFDLQTARGEDCSFQGHVPIGIRVPLPEGSEHLVPGTPEHALAQEILHHRPGRGGLSIQAASGVQSPGWARGGRAAARRTPSRLAAQSPPHRAQEAAAAMRSCPAARNFRRIRAIPTTSGARTRDPAAPPLPPHPSPSPAGVAELRV
uniref:Uncharacterized protein n=1 Tax=Felis catus TaxID=9685 RepID=A0ABI7Z8Y8_FELCA